VFTQLGIAVGAQLAQLKHQFASLARHGVVAKQEQLPRFAYTYKLCAFCYAGLPRVFEWQRRAIRKVGAVVHTLARFQHSVRSIAKTIMLFFLRAKDYAFFNKIYKLEEVVKTLESV
jgi:hypothetical protein